MEPEQQHLIADDLPAEPAPATEETVTPEPVLDGEPGQESQAPADDDAGAPRNKGVERRIGQLTRKYREEQRKREELAAELEAIKKRLGPIPEPPRPRPDDFESTVEYEDALLEWNDARKQHKQNTEAPKAAPPEAPPPDPVAQRLKEGIKALEAQYPDATELVFNDDWPCNGSTYEFIANSDRGPELAYALASDLDLAEKIDAMSPVLAARELVKLEAGLPAAKPTPGAGPVNAPPPPATPVKPGPTKATVDPDKMTPKQWRAWREAELAKRA